jgi:hypothetical protein
LAVFDKDIAGSRNSAPLAIAHAAGPLEPLPLGECPQSPYYDIHRLIGNDRFTSIRDVAQTSQMRK